MSYETKEGYKVGSSGGFIRCTQLPPDGKTEYDKQYVNERQIDEKGEGEFGDLISESNVLCIHHK